MNAHGVEVLVRALRTGQVVDAQEVIKAHTLCASNPRIRDEVAFHLGISSLNLGALLSRSLPDPKRLSFRRMDRHDRRYKFLYW